MDDATNPATEVVTDDIDVIEAEQPEADSELDDQGNPIEPEPQEADDDEEVEVNGKTYKIPKDWAGRQADYTRKTQEVAEQRKSYDAAIARISEINETETQAIRKVAILDAQLAQYENVDWATWDEQDPVGALRARHQFTELQRLHEGAVNEQTTARENAERLTKQEIANQQAQAQAVLSKTIPGWGAEKARAIGTFAKEAYGVPLEFWATATDPTYVQVIHDAMQWRQSQKKAATAKKVEAQQAIQPAVTVKGKGGNVPRGLSDDLSADEWIKRRNAQVRKRNK